MGNGKKILSNVGYAEISIGEQFIFFSCDIVTVHGLIVNKKYENAIEDAEIIIHNRNNLMIEKMKKIINDKRYDGNYVIYRFKIQDCNNSVSGYHFLHNDSMIEFILFDTDIFSFIIVFNNFFYPREGTNRNINNSFFNKIISYFDKEEDEMNVNFIVDFFHEKIPTEIVIINRFKENYFSNTITNGLFAMKIDKNLDPNFEVLKIFCDYRFSLEIPGKIIIELSKRVFMKNYVYFLLPNIIPDHIYHSNDIVFKFDNHDYDIVFMTSNLRSNIKIMEFRNFNKPIAINSGCLFFELHNIKNTYGFFIMCEEEINKCSITNKLTPIDSGLDILYRYNDSELKDLERSVFNIRSIKTMERYGKRNIYWVPFDGRSKWNSSTSSIGLFIGNYFNDDITITFDKIINGELYFVSMNDSI
jgi:hypothetical protein